MLVARLPGVQGPQECLMDTFNDLRAQASRILDTSLAPAVDLARWAFDLERAAWADGYSRGRGDQDEINDDY